MSEIHDDNSPSTTSSATLKRRQLFRALTVGALSAAAAGNLLLVGCNDSGGAIVPTTGVPIATALTITGAPASSVPQLQQNVGTLPAGTGPAPVVNPTTTGLDSNRTTTITVTTPQAVNVIGVSIRGSNRYLTVTFPNVTRQTTGQVTYSLQVTLDSTPSTPAFLDITTQTGTQVSQAATVTITLAA